MFIVFVLTLVVLIMGAAIASRKSSDGLSSIKSTTNSQSNRCDEIVNELLDLMEKEL